MIARRLLERHAQRAGREGVTFSEAAMAALTAYPWPGNVRELSNAIEFALTLSSGPIIDAEQLPSYVPARREAPAAAAPPPKPRVNTEVSYSQARADTLREFERAYLEELMRVTEGNLSAAARRSGIDRSNLRRMLRQHGITSAGGASN